MNRLKVFLKSPEKKNLFKMTKEFFTLMIKKKEIPFYYFKYLYQKDIPNYLDYLSLQEQRKFQHHKSLHNPELVTLINNKLYFNLMCDKTSIKRPKFISFNLQSRFFFKDETLKIQNKEELFHFFKKIFRDTKVEGLFFRPPSDYGGKGCFKITEENLDTELNKVYEILRKGIFVHTEVIKQNSIISKIHNNSVNTLRIITLNTNINEIQVISVFIRFGVGDSVVDNASSGGFFVGVNLNSGTLKRVGYFKPGFGGKKPTKHPDSGFKFEGFKIPYYKEACESVINAAKVIPDRLIGWDVAITDEGPIIIESNAEPNMHTSDIAYGGLLRNEHVKKVLEELK